MSLRSRIQDLGTAAAVANDEHQVRLRTGQLSELSERLHRPLDDLPTLATALAEIRRFDPELPPELNQDAAQSAEGLRAIASELPAMSVHTNLDLAKTRVRGAEKFATEVRALVSERWRRYVAQPPPPINDDLLDALAQGGVDVESIRNTMESAHAQLIAVINRTIPQAGDFAKFGAAFEAMRACGNQIGSVVDSDIAEGILGAQMENGKPLSWFTAERVRALADLGIIERFRVRLQ